MNYFRIFQVSQTKEHGFESIETTIVFKYSLVRLDDLFYITVIKLGQIDNYQIWTNKKQLWQSQDKWKKKLTYFIVLFK